MKMLIYLTISIFKFFICLILMKILDLLEEKKFCIRIKNNLVFYDLVEIIEI